MAFSSFTWPFRRRSSSGEDGPSKPAAPYAAEEELGVRRSSSTLSGLSPPKPSSRPPSSSTKALLQTSSPLDSARSVSVSDCAFAAGGSAEAAGGELSDWQQRHAVLVLARAKELAKIRYDLCPRHMKDKQFWTLYFLLARTYILPEFVNSVSSIKILPAGDAADGQAGPQAPELVRWEEVR